jgi:riboflavin synthase
MFTGIIEVLGEVIDISAEGENITFEIKSNLTPELKVDQSLAHNGVCLTVDSLQNGNYTVTAIAETLRKTNVGDWKIGDKVNLERAMAFGGRMDGHLVQGHVDTTGICTSIKEENGSWEYVFEYNPAEKEYMTVPKGSICVNGVSLTVVRSELGLFSVHIIPYTYKHTNFHQFKVGSKINLEFDILGKYFVRWMENYKSA